MNKKLYQLSQQLGQLLLAKQDRLATAESCTGGLVAAAITSVAGSSQWFDRGVVSYSNEAKKDMLDVQAATLEQWGAVSAEVATEMAQGIINRSQANLSLAITGIAGPQGGSADKPVGTVWFAWAGVGDPMPTSCQHFSGDRQAIQQQAAEFALRYLLDNL